MSQVLAKIVLDFDTKVQGPSVLWITILHTYRKNKRVRDTGMVFIDLCSFNIQTCKQSSTPVIVGCKLSSTHLAF